jgi:hypothetical protein
VPLSTAAWFAVIVACGLLSAILLFNYFED